MIKDIIQKIINNDNDKTTIIIRLIVGIVFFSEGIQKFIFPDIRGAGRFLKIGLPFPDFLGYLVGSFETICGLFILLGLLSRIFSFPLIIIMLVAFISTKFPILINEGIFEFLHDSRTDLSMLLGSIFILIKGSGRFSIDQKLIDKFKK